MGIRTIHTLSGEPFFIEVPGDEMPSEAIELIQCKLHGGNIHTIPSAPKSDAQYYSEHLAKQRQEQNTED
jgi:hypothetical protein